jgi:hypothetical protein
MVSEAPPPEEVSTAVPLPRPHGKSLVGIVIDEPIDMDAPAFAPPQRPEDLLDAVDDDDEPEPQSAAPVQRKPPAQEDDEDATRIYIPTGKTETSPEPTANPAAAAGNAAKAAAAAEPPSSPPPKPAAVSNGRSGVSGARPRGAALAGGGQALAIALALAVVAVVTIVVRVKSGGDSTPPSASKPVASGSIAASAATETADCVAAFFPSGSIDRSKNFDFLCRAVDLRSITKQMKKRLASVDGSESPASTDWDGLGWFELPLAATMRHSCCSKAIAERILLPQPPAACESLSAVLKRMTAPPFTAENVGNRSGDFERAVECLTQEKQASAYGYDDGVDAENKQTFQSFLDRQAASVASQNTEQ